MKIAKLAKISKNNPKNNIALIGHMGSGKSMLGKLISKELKYNHIDTDTLIEKNLKSSIENIFSTKGEEYFRKIEEKSIINILNPNKLVLSLGGGSILNIKIRKYLENNYIIIFLDVEFTILAKRLKNSNKRPLIQNVNIEKKIKELDIKRRKYYLLADIILKNQKTIKETLSEFRIKYNKFHEKNN